MLYDVMKKTRENKELTQKQLSDILGVGRSTYAGWENGIDTIPLYRLNDLCNYLDISLDYICHISNNKSGSSFLKRFNSYSLFDQKNKNKIVPEMDINKKVTLYQNSKIIKSITHIEISHQSIENIILLVDFQLQF